jgi:2-polyprenyl-3-methyl-5-hydroxy-6-metoxy-1,4-benzoquinol methylase
MAPAHSGGAASRRESLNMKSEATSTIFERPDASFEPDPRLLEWILEDPANPLSQIARMIPAGARVLDVGAGNGILARLLAHLGKTVEIDGIEPNEIAARLATPFYGTLSPEPVDLFLANRPTLPPYDFIVLADVVEHIANPAPTLRSLRERLAPEGRICLSTPNIAFAAVRLALLNGRFDYVDSGILERTHLRFFTLCSLQALVASTGLFPRTTMMLRRSPVAMEIRLERDWIGPWQYHRIMKDELASVYQFLLVLGANPGPARQESFGSAGSLDYLRYLKRRWFDRAADRVE